MKQKRKRPPCDSIVCPCSKKAHAAHATCLPEPAHHYLSIYRNQPINFKDLAAVDSSFSEAWEKLQRRQRENRFRSESTTDRAKAASRGSKNDGGGKQSFSTHVDREFNTALTRALLRRDFQLLLPSIPSGYLCPPLPNRLNYVCWVRELLDRGMECDPPEHGKARQYATQQFFYQGIDIGTGATCIYPLLLSTAVFSGTDNSATHWKFLATDVDPTSVQSALQNIKANNLQERIHVVCVPKSRNCTSYTVLQPNSNEQQKNNEFCSVQGPILTAVNAVSDSGMFSYGGGMDNGSPNLSTTMTNETKVLKSSPNYYSSYPCFDFVMTNPPFYSTFHEADGCRIGDGRERTEMTKSEGVYEGGEYAFISDMIQDSMVLRSRITWYTSMMGKKTTLREVEKKLRSIGFGRANIRTTEFIQGKTRRWGIAWTFQESPERLIGEQNGFVNMLMLCLYNHVMLSSRDDATTVLPSFAHPNFFFLKNSGSIALKMKPLPTVKFTINTNHMRSLNALDEVLSRIWKFCQINHHQKLRCNQATCNSNESIVITIKSDKSICEAEDNRSSSQNDSFLMDIFLLQKPKLIHDDDELCSIYASCNAYSHSPKGDAMVRRTVHELTQYVCQTSRYWRRLQAKTNEQELNTASSVASIREQKSRVI